MLEKFSSFKLLCRVTARMRRLFIKDPPNSRMLLCKEIERERIRWIKVTQTLAFHSEIQALANKQPIHPKSKLLAFNPFLDKNRILRVGGRLKEAMIHFDSKHQIIIPKESRLATLIINDAHESTKHGGTQLTMAYTRNQYWIINMRNTVRFHIRKCIKCRRYAAEMQEQLMGTLPAASVNMSRAFVHSGIDYAGPMEVLKLRKRGQRQVTKGYVALFVCICTKAVHIELVSDMTTDTFLSAFTRFTSRRGLPSMMYSDNAKTFIGARNEFFKEYEIIKSNLEPELADIVLKDITCTSLGWHMGSWNKVDEKSLKKDYR